MQAEGSFVIIEIESIGLLRPWRAPLSAGTAKPEKWVPCPNRAAGTFLLRPSPLSQDGESALSAAPFGRYFP